MRLKSGLWIAFIFVNAAFFMALQLHGNDMYFLRLNSIQKIANCILFYFLATADKYNPYPDLIRKAAIVFTVGYAIVMCYVFLPQSIRCFEWHGYTFSQILLFIFFGLSLLASFMLLVYCYLMPKK